MKHNLTIKTLCVIFLVIAVTSGFTQPQKALPATNVPDNIKVLLGDYSQYLNTGKASRQSFYSSAMETLVVERRNYYNEFYSVGLHSNLISINSEFQVADAKITKIGKVYHVEVLELVTMSGYPNLNSAEDYPMISAAHWAISQTDNDNVKKALIEYIASTTDAVNDSIINGAETVFRIKHKIEIVETKNGQMQFVKDVFNEKEVDNGDGFDTVNWGNGGFSRSRPDLTQMPDYVIYHTPTEVLGEQLLSDYTKAYGGITPEGTGFTYQRSTASNYALTYTSAATAITCSGVYQNTAWYNPAYQTMWNWTGCDDCADFVSQALRAGGFPTDSRWNYTGTAYDSGPGTYGWRVFDFTNSTWPNGTLKVGLAYYLQTYLGAITVYSSYTSLQVGDLMYDNNTNLHVVMVTRISPFGYSGHTNDRKNRGYDSVLQKFWHVKTNVP
jgi:hypothetical protein